MSKVGAVEGWSGMAVMIPWILLIIFIIALVVIWPGLQMICYRGYGTEDCSKRRAK